MPNSYSSWRTGVLIDNIYPVGSIYLSVNATNPGTLFGGTWERILDTFLLGAGTTYTAGSTGGNSTTSLGTANLPSHTHGLNAHTHSIPALSGTAASNGGHTHTLTGLSGYDDNNFYNGGYNYVGLSDRYTADSSKYGYWFYPATSSAGAHTHSVSTNASTSGGNSGETTAVGSGTAFSNMPPYLVVYIWKRIA